MAQPIIINMQVPTAICCICGKHDLSRWGVPIAMDTALIVANDYEGEWGAKPACENCYQKHASGEFVGHDPRY